MLLKTGTAYDFNMKQLKDPRCGGLHHNECTLRQGQEVFAHERSLRVDGNLLRGILLGLRGLLLEHAASWQGDWLTQRRTARRRRRVHADGIVADCDDEFIDTEPQGVLRNRLIHEDQVPHHPGRKVIDSAGVDRRPIDLAGVIRVPRLPVRDRGDPDFAEESFLVDQGP